MTRRCWPVAVALAALGGAVAPAAAVVNYHVLPNGVRVLVREEARASVVAISLQVHGGSRLETADTAGITNFLHRAMMRGTLRRTGDQLAEAAERLGGAVDASGDLDQAEVRGTALARHWEELLTLVAEVALRPALAGEEIERERRLILGQIQTRADDPFPLAYDTLMADLYGPHPYARPAVGRRETVSSIGRDALAAHHRALYRGDRLVLAVSGRIDRDRVRRAAERLFAAVPAGGADHGPAPPAPVASHGRRVVVKRAEQAQILVGFLGPSAHERDHAAVKVLAAVLGGGMSARLFIELRDRQGLAYALGVLHPMRAGPAPVVAHVATAPENVEVAEAEVRRELTRARVEDVSPDELARAKSYVLGELGMDRRRNARHAWYLAFFEGLGLGWDFPERYARAVEALTAAEVRAAADRYLTAPTTVVLVTR